MARKKTYTRKLHWTDRRRAIANIGEALQERGWTLYGYHADNSDLMTDYYDPSSWKGVATHPDLPGFVVGVGVDDYVVNQHSGKDEVHSRSKEAGDCPFCQGTGRDPSGVTYAEAKADLKKYHFVVRSKEQGAIPLLPVVSPLHFHDDGSPKCLTCGGTGKRHVPEHFVACTWPEFHATPRGRAWHVEINGHIVATGTGLAACAGYGREAREEAAKVADDITATARARRLDLDVMHSRAESEREAEAEKQVASADTPARLEYDRDWTWIYFDAKPAEEIRAGLRDLGFRWSRRRSGWYATERIDEAQLTGVIA